MATPFLGELKIVSFGFAPKGWAMANGQLLPINQNQALFALLGTTYGGNGQTTFALPDLRSRTPMHFGGSVVQGQRAGEESHTLNVGEMPQHVHGLAAQSVPAVAGAGPSSNTFANAATRPYRNNPSQTVAMAPLSSVAGSGQPHSNLQPYLTLNIVIALVGVFPSRN